MGSSGRVIVAAVLLVLCLAGVSVFARNTSLVARTEASSTNRDGGATAGALDRGELAPYREGWLGERAVLARIPSATFGPSPILEIDVLGDTAVILQPQRWWLARHGALRGPFGTAGTRAPLLGARTIAVARDDAGTIIVLDNKRGSVLFWDRRGEPLARTVDLTSAGRVRLQQVNELGLDRNGNVLVTAHGLEGGRVIGSWLLLRYDSTAVDTLLRATAAGAPGRAFATITASTLPDGSAVAVTARDYGVWWFAAHGHATGMRVRERAPRWRVSALAHARIAKLLARAPAAMGADGAYSEPEYIPAVQQVVALDNRCVVVATVTGFSDRVYFEVLDSSGHAVGRLTEAPLSGKWKLTTQGIVWRREERGETVVEFQPFRIPDSHASH